MPAKDQTPSDYKICVAGVTDAPVQEVGSFEPIGDFDRGHSDDGWLIELLTKPGTDRLECSGVRTRSVCQLP